MMGEVMMLGMVIRMVVGGGDDGGGWGVGWPHCVDTIVNSLMLGIK